MSQEPKQKQKQSNLCKILIAGRRSGKTIAVLRNLIEVQIAQVDRDLLEWFEKESYLETRYKTREDFIHAFKHWKGRKDALSDLLKSIESLELGGVENETGIETE